MIRGSRTKKAVSVTPHQAARVAVRLAIRRAVVDLVDNSASDNFRTLAAARRRLEATVRRHRKAPARDLRQLADAVVMAAPESHRDRVATALRALSDAETDELVVEQDIGFALGLAFGQTLRDDESWDPNSLFDKMPFVRPGRRRR